MRNSAAKKTIFIVEDHDLLRKAMSEYLRKKGFHVETASNAMEAMDYLSIGKPDIVLLDVGLPDVDGIDICWWIRQSETLSSTPIIMVTGFTGMTDKMTGYKAGANRYLCKPFSLAGLLDEICFLLQPAQPHGGMGYYSNSLQYA